MRGCLTLIAWTPLSLLVAGPILQPENLSLSGYPGAPEPSLWPTSEEWLALAVWSVFWLAGLASIVTVSRLWRTARDLLDVDALPALSVALVWALVVGWLMVGVERLLYPEPSRFQHADLWSWSIDSPAEFVLLPSLAILLWCGGLAAMLLTVRTIWRWLPAH